MINFNLENTVSVHITDKCNLRCPYCYQADYCGYSKVIEKEKAYHAIKSLNPKTVLAFGGEPMLFSKEVNDLFDTFTSLGCQVGIITNGTIWNEEIFNKAGIIMLTLESFFFNFSPQNRKYTDKQWANIKKLLKNYRDKILITHNLYPFNNDKYYERIAKLGDFESSPYPIISYTEDAEYDINTLMQFNTEMDILDLPKLRVWTDGSISRDMRQKYKICEYNEWDEKYRNQKVPIHKKCVECKYSSKCPGYKMFPHFCKDVLDKIEDPHFCKIARWIYEINEQKN